MKFLFATSFSNSPPKPSVICILIIFLILLVAPLTTPTTTTTTPSAIYILAGQSNMAGRGGTYNSKRKWDGLTPPECQSNPNILRLNKDLIWEEAHEPLHKNIPFSYCFDNPGPFGVGPGMPFSNSLLKRFPAIGTIGLVPCAVGGTNISAWSKGTCLYERLLNRTRASLSSSAGGCPLRAMLWYQGESDCDPKDSPLYKARLEKFFNDFRSDLQLPSLPIIQVALASGGMPRGSDKAIVRAAQLNTSLPNVKCVDADGLPLNGDNLHLTTISQVRLGTMLADANLKYFK